MTPEELAQLSLNAPQNDTGIVYAPAQQGTAIVPDITSPTVQRGLVEQGLQQDSTADTMARELAGGVDESQQNLYGFVNLLGSVLGSDTLQEIGTDGVIRNVREAAANAPKYKSLDDIDTPSDVASAIGEYALRAFPELATDAAITAAGAATAPIGGGVTAATALFGKSILKEIALSRAKKAGTAAMFASHSGEARNNSLDEGIDNPYGDLVVGAANTALDLAPIKLSLDALLKKHKGEITPEYVAKSIGLKTAEVGAVGAVTEPLQNLTQYISNAAQKDGYDIFSDKNINDMLFSSLIGGGVSGTIGGGAQAANLMFNGSAPTDSATTKQQLLLPQEQQAQEQQAQEQQAQEQQVQTKNLPTIFNTELPEYDNYGPEPADPHSKSPLRKIFNVLHSDESTPDVKLEQAFGLANRIAKKPEGKRTEVENEYLRVVEEYARKPLYAAYAKAGNNEAALAQHMPSVVDNLKAKLTELYDESPDVLNDAPVSTDALVDALHKTDDPTAKALVEKSGSEAAAANRIYTTNEKNTLYKNEGSQLRNSVGVINHEELQHLANSEVEQVTTDNEGVASQENNNGTQLSEKTTPITFIHRGEKEDSPNINPKRVFKSGSNAIKNRVKKLNAENDGFEYGVKDVYYENGGVKGQVITKTPITETTADPKTRAFEPIIKGYRRYTTPNILKGNKNRGFSVTQKVDITDSKKEVDSLVADGDNHNADSIDKRHNVSFSDLINASLKGDIAAGVGTAQDFKRRIQQALLDGIAELQANGIELTGANKKDPISIQLRDAIVASIKQKFPKMDRDTVIKHAFDSVVYEANGKSYTLSDIFPTAFKKVEATDVAYLGAGSKQPSKDIHNLRLYKTKKTAAARAKRADAVSKKYTYFLHEVKDKNGAVKGYLVARKLRSPEKATTGYTKTVGRPDSRGDAEYHKRKLETAKRIAEGAINEPKRVKDDSKTIKAVAKVVTTEKQLSSPLKQTPLEWAYSILEQDRLANSELGTLERQAIQEQEYETQKAASPVNMDGTPKAAMSPKQQHTPLNAKIDKIIKQFTRRLKLKHKPLVIHQLADLKTYAASVPKNIRADIEADLKALSSNDISVSERESFARVYYNNGSPLIVIGPDVPTQAVPLLLAHEMGHVFMQQQMESFTPEIKKRLNTAYQKHLAKHKLTEEKYPKKEWFADQVALHLTDAGNYTLFRSIVSLKAADIAKRLHAFVNSVIPKSVSYMRAKYVENNSNKVQADYFASRLDRSFMADIIFKSITMPELKDRGPINNLLVQLASAAENYSVRDIYSKLKAIAKAVELLHTVKPATHNDKQLSYYKEQFGTTKEIYTEAKATDSVNTTATNDTPTVEKVLADVATIAENGDKQDAQKLNRTLSDVLAIVTNAITSGLSKIRRFAFNQSYREHAINKAQKAWDDFVHKRDNFYKKTFISLDENLRHIGAEGSPQRKAAVFVADQLFTPVYTKKKPGYANVVNASMGLWLSHYDKVINTIPDNLRNDVLEFMQSEQDTSEAPRRIKGYVAKLRKVHEAFYREVVSHIELGDVGYKENHFPREYNLEAIEQNYNEFVELIEKKAEEAGEKVDAVAVADSLMARLRGDAPEINIESPTKGNANERVLWFVDNKSLQKFLSPELDETITAYVQRMVKRYEFESRFGGYETIDGVKVFNPSKKLHKAMSVMSKKDADYVMAAVQAHLGVYNPNHISAEFKGNQALLMSMTNAAWLWLTTAWSLVELGQIPVRMRDTPLSDILKVAKSKSFKEQLDRARDWGLTDEKLMQQLLNSTYGSPSSGTYAGKMADKINEFTFKYNGQQWATSALRAVAANLGENFIVSNAKKAKQGDSTARDYIAELIGDKHVDSTIDAILEWNANGRKLPTIDSTYRTHKNSDAKVAPEVVVQHMISRFVDEAVMRPNAGQRPLWASNPMFAMLAHMKPYFFAVHNTILPQLIESLKKTSMQNVAAATPLLAVGLFMLPLSLIALELREEVKWVVSLGGHTPRTHNMSPAELVYSAFTNANMFFGFEPIRAAAVSSQYSANPIVGSAVGFVPAAGYLQKLLSGEVQDVAPIIGTF